MSKSKFDTPAYQQIKKVSLKDGVVKVVFAKDTVELPWDAIRYLTDPAYKKYTASKECEHNILMGARLCKLRKQSGMTQKQVDKEMGLAGGLMQHIEAGKTRPSFATLRLILKALGKEMKDLAE